MNATERCFALPLYREDERVPQSSNGLYLKRRAQQSLAAESVATDRSARMAHSQLAAAYARRALSGGRDGVVEEAEIELPDAERDAPLMPWASERDAT